MAKLSRRGLVARVEVWDSKPNGETTVKLKKEWCFSHAPEGCEKSYTFLNTKLAKRAVAAAVLR